MKMHTFHFDISKVTFEELYENKEYETVTLYFFAPKEWLGELHPEAISAEISVEYPIAHPEAIYATVMMSPTRVNEENDSIEDYDWHNVVILPSKIEQLIDLAKKKKRKKSTNPKEKIITQHQQLAKEIPQTAEPEKKEKLLNRKKPADKNSEKHLDARKEFLRVFRHLTYRHRSWDVWSDFIIMFACALSNPMDKNHFDEREALYLRTIKRYNKQEQPLFSELAAYTVVALEENQEQDFLGSIYTELGLNSKEHEQIFTPYHVCELMAEITMEDVVEKVKKDGYITLNDPCCGAGATLIAGIHAARKRLEKANLNYQNHILVAAQDIDMVVALMCYIQLSLLGVAAYIKVGNSLTEPMTENDSLDNYWFTMMYFSDVWSMRRLFRSL